MIGRKIERIDDNAMLGALYLVNACRLFFNGHILVNYAQTALARNGNRQTSVGNGVHGGRQKRDVQLNPLCKRHREVNLSGQYVALVRNEQNIIKRQAFPNHRHFPFPLGFFRTFYK